MSLGANRIRRDYSRYDKLCVQCMRMVRCKNLSRHVREQHPNGFEGEFVPCLVSSRHLRHITQRNPPGTESVGTQTAISWPPYTIHTHLGQQLQHWTQQDFIDIVRRILDLASEQCLMCTLNAEFAKQDDGLFTFEPIFNFADHVDGCKGPAYQLLARHLPPILRERGIDELGEVVVATHYISKLLEAECLRLGQ
jgi:hypothetical protein